MNASGRDDTAFANGVLNGMASYISYCASWYKIRAREVTADLCLAFANVIRLAVCGDDSIAFLPCMSGEARSSFVARLRENIASFGFKAKAFASNRIVDAVFLGHRPVRVAGRYFWSRTIGRALFKLGWQAETKGDGAAWMTGIMDMHKICSPHVPILSDIAECWVQAHNGAKRTPVKLDPNKPWEWMTRGLSLPRYDQQTLEDLALAYSVYRDAERGDLVPTCVSVTAQDIQDCITHVRMYAATGLPHVLDHWVLKHMVWVDEQ